MISFHQPGYPMIQVDDSDAITACQVLSEIEMPGDIRRSYEMGCRALNPVLRLVPLDVMRYLAMSHALKHAMHVISIEAGAHWSETSCIQHLHRLTETCLTMYMIREDLNSLGDIIRQTVLFTDEYGSKMRADGIDEQSIFILLSTLSLAATEFWTIDDVR